MIRGMKELWVLQRGRRPGDQQSSEREEKEGEREE